MKNWTKIGLACIFLIAGCNKRPEKIEREYLTHAIEQTKMDSNYQWIVVLPGLGCHGCIQEAEMFMKDHIANSQILFVLTKISSLKILQQKTGVNISEHPNIRIDKDNTFNIPTDNSIYPCIIQLKDGKLLTHSFQSPGNAAFDQLEKIIDYQDQ